ncbi:YDG/SRA domain-containing protein [Streptomyces spiramyceticus]|uniref:YDG/SRA domain-containing protein n=1 Tax=Streptomyces spiramyceticus TaxID=299717 RepID=UPI00237C5067|nr:YDG/SRA domain-containing protein [Streptomyces spiramyceticus]
MVAYRAVFGHVGEVLPGTRFDYRQEVKVAKLHKEERAGISWGRDGDDERAADAIVLSKGYEDDVDQWFDILYTGAGGRDENTGRQVADQDWDNYGNAGLRRSRIKGYPIRVIRGLGGDEDYSPVSGYRYDGLYEILEECEEVGVSGFRICRFKLRRLVDERQELTPVEQQVQDMLDGAPPRVTTTVERIIRDTAVARRVKQWYGHTCQICRTALVVGAGGVSYAEGAHIQALGKPTNGPDVDGNVLCLCPNCHVRLDRGAIYLTDDLVVVDRYAPAPAAHQVRLKTVEHHSIQKRFIRAHRRFWKIEGQSS